METNSVINLEDIMVCDPISKRGREAMSRVKARVPEAKMTFSDFYNQIYVAPFFLEKSVSQNLEEDKTQQDVYETGTDFSFSPAGVSNEQLNRDKMTYEEKFFSKKSNVVLFLRAFSGAGKSIYLNELKWERRKHSGNGAEDVDLSFENGYLASANELSFDLEECISTITKGNVTFPSSDYVIPTENNLAISAPWCFFCTLLEATFDMILSFIVRNDKSDCDRVENNFKIIYGVNYPDETGLVFTLMKHKENGKIDERDISSQLLSTLLRVSFSSTIKSTPSVRTCISNLLQIMTRVIVCKSNLSNPNQVLISLEPV